MPNRILREAILTSEPMSRLGWPEEVFYRRLMSVVDDYGRCEANLQLLRSRCYPLQTDIVRVADITRWLAACQKAGVILLYEVVGKQYLEISKFGQQQRSVSKFPPPPADASKCYQELADEHLDVSVFGVVSEDVSASSANAGFERFWDAWPSGGRKQAKGKCLEAWKKAKAESIAEQVFKHVESLKQTEDWTKQGGQFVPAPLVYLNNRRWEGFQPAQQAPSSLGHYV